MLNATVILLKIVRLFNLFYNFFQNEGIKEFTIKFVILNLILLIIGRYILLNINKWHL